MPLLRFHFIEGRSADEIGALLDIAHGALVAAFGVPAEDRYQIATTHPRHEMVAMDTCLGLERSDKLVMVEVVSRPRTRTQKVALYSLLCSRLHRGCGLDREDLIVTFIENSDEDWSFGRGRAQFLTGELGDQGHRNVVT
ncbi:tautomerase family protein [Rhodococcus sp. IEGM 1381]|uniref:tautomerase family protein n=1 Tax=Rhodococcus sp. IEGM 1381 TaxID=3047085 RepID=UPI0024B6ED4E|nr:tautomerase family protein [Rhodococcus sp. IEGM 1381]MDI9897465.1 tautomerase family protein [Rhodococcus sp. IEGM 1381]